MVNTGLEGLIKVEKWSIMNGLGNNGHKWLMMDEMERMTMIHDGCLVFIKDRIAVSSHQSTTQSYSTLVYENLPIDTFIITLHETASNCIDLHLHCIYIIVHMYITHLYLCTCYLNIYISYSTRNTALQ